MRKHRWSLSLFYSLIVFAYLIISIGIFAIAMWVLAENNVIYIHEERLPENITIIVVTGLISLVLGYAFALLTGRFSMSPFSKIVSEASRLASGDFKARIKFSAVVSNLPAFKELSDSFNKLAEELQNTEILRSDFINNFSHEYKTPLVSISGFAELIESENITDEERIQYARVIKEEAKRLTTMATNVLYLTKLENQSILTEKSAFNLSEQLRSAILLLEPKWSAKNIDLDLVFDEYEINANEEMLKQVWINLIDNAVKFSPEGGLVSVRIEQENSGTKVIISNTGEDIPQQKINFIFRKFYQADESHATKGNGIGLAIVKKIVELHYGSTQVKSENGTTTFTVFIPK